MLREERSLVALDTNYIRNKYWTDKERGSCDDHVRKYLAKIFVGAKLPPAVQPFCLEVPRFLGSFHCYLEGYRNAAEPAGSWAEQ